MHTSKHLNAVRADAPEQSYFEASTQAGKAGNLLARMAADVVEVIPKARVKEYARAANVRVTEVDHCLRLLKDEGKIDYQTDAVGGFGDVEVYSFSSSDALTTTARLFDRLEPSEQERGSIETLEETFYMPQTEGDMLDSLHESGLGDSDAKLTLELQDALGLVKTSDVDKGKLYYNEYAFNIEPEKALKVIGSLRDADARNVKDIQELLKGTPGYPMELLTRKFPPTIVNMMEGIGMIDAMPVRSPNGQAVYVTIPQLRGVAIDQPILSTDVFHKAKTLLNCLRYGQHHSVAGRGRIVDEQMLVNVIRKLIRGEELRPSTAAGEDYRILERDGVIQTRHHAGSMYFMSLRQKEVGQVVLQMLLHNTAVPEADINLLTDLGAVAMEREIPEVRRNQILNRRTRDVEIAQNEVLQVVRGGGRRT